MVVVANNLVKKYKDMVAVNGIDFEVQEKECFGFIGPNGAGKTTTMKMIYCFVPRTSGELQVLGKDPGVQPELAKATLGVVPQDNNLDEDLNVFTNLTMYANYFDIPKAIASKRAKELLAFVQLTGKEKVKINELSSGMKRRLMIARGLINDPKLLILDEPTVGLDPQARHLIWDRLHELKNQNVSMIITTHYMDEAMELCDRIAVMDKGRIMVVGKPKDLIREHIGEEVVEVRLLDSTVDKLKQDSSGFQVTLEETSQKCYLYCQDCRLLLNHLADQGYKHILRRPATLEDVFLKLTGRDLVDTFDGVEIRSSKQEKRRRSVLKSIHDFILSALRPAINRFRMVSKAEPLSREVKGLIKVSYRWTKVWYRNYISFLKFFYVNLVGNLGDPILYLLAMGFGLGAFLGQIAGVSYVQFLAPGIIVSSAMFAAVYECTFESFLKMIHLKTYDAIIVTPVNIEDVVAGDIVWGATKAMLSGIMMFVVIAAFGLIHSWWSFLIPLLIFLVGFHFASFAMLITAWAPNFDYFSYFLELVITPLFFFSGIFFPLNQSPGWLQALSGTFPLTHAVELSRALVMGTVPQRPITNMLFLIIPSVGLFYWSVWRMKKRMIK